MNVAATPAGRPVDLAPWSPDLPAVVDALNALRRRVPSRADAVLPSVVDRWAAYLDDPRDVDWFAGDAVLYADWDPANVLIDRDGSADLVRWAGATRGPGWADPACWVVWLVAAGHEPAAAERWASQVTAWSDGPQRALDLFAVVQARRWAAAGAVRLRDAATAWVAHRRPLPR
jgi:hypothetical protein